MSSFKDVVGHKNIIQYIENAVKTYLVSSIEEHTKIRFAENQNDAGMLGAFYHFCGRHVKE